MNDRRTGKTTRQVDDLVQLIFKESKVEIKGDFYERYHTSQILSKRLKNEHNIECKIFNYGSHDNGTTLISL